MSFLLDTDICSAYLKNDRLVTGRATLHFGALQISVVTMGELLTWALRAKSSTKRRAVIHGFLSMVNVIDLGRSEAAKFGEIRAGLLDNGVQVKEPDLLIASTALVHNLTLVTHNTADVINIPGLTLADWLIP